MKTAINSIETEGILLKALIVDDSSFAQRTLKAFLEKIYSGIEIVVACNGKIGYAFFLQEKPDVIFTDLLMPEMTGQEMIEKIRAMDAAVPIFVLTADIQKATKFELVQYNIVAFINKPLSNEAGDVIKRKIGAPVHA